MGNDYEVPDVRVVVDCRILHDAITTAECFALKNVAMTMPIYENKVVLHRCKVLNIEVRQGSPPNRTLHIACTLSRPSMGVRGSATLPSPSKRRCKGTNNVRTDQMPGQLLTFPHRLPANIYRLSIKSTRTAYRPLTPIFDDGECRIVFF